MIEVCGYTSIVKTTRRQDEFWITRPAQVRALTSPVRQEIVDALESAGPCTMARLGELIGRPPDGLYFHIRRLVRVGLILEREPHREGRHVSAVYDLPGRPVRLRYAAPASAKDLSAVVAAALRTGSREFAAGVREHLRSGAAEPPAGLWGARAKGWLTPREAAEVRGLLTEAMGILRRGAPREGAAPVSLSLALAPVDDKTGDRS